MGSWEIEVEKVHVDNLEARLRGAREAHGDVPRSEWEQINAACDAAVLLVRSGVAGTALDEVGVALAGETGSEPVVTVSVAYAQARPEEPAAELAEDPDHTPLGRAAVAS